MTVKRRQFIRIAAGAAAAAALGPYAARQAAAAEWNKAGFQAKAVDEVRRRKPYLFRARESASPALSPRVDGAERALAPVEHAAQQARSTGDRRDLLAYLRLRRK